MGIQELEDNLQKALLAYLERLSEVSKDSDTSDQEDRIETLESKVEDCESRLDNATLDI